jgi:spore coat polysaccharide biosynthesis protein SpsF
VGALVQARMGSTRLPGKVLLPLPLSGQASVLAQVLRRARRAATLHTVVVATSTLPADEQVARAAAALGAPVFRGDEADVLGRFQEAAAAHDLDVIVRLTGDNPAIDPHYLDQAVRAHQAAGADYTLTTGLPLGTNLEIIGRPALERAAAEARLPEEREHVTPYLRRHPERFRLQTLALTAPGAPATLRLTLDYPSDYAFLHLLFTSLAPDFGLAEVGRLLAAQPWLPHINHDNHQVKV